MFCSLEDDVSIGSSKAEGVDSNESFLQGSWLRDNLQFSIDQPGNVLVGCVVVEIRRNDAPRAGDTDLNF